MGGFLSRRMEMACLLLSGLIILYTLRVNMSVAAQQMRVDLNWSETEKGYVLSSFYWGYVLGQIPASCIAQYYGAKWLFGWSVAIPSFLTILVPMACHHSLSAALTMRVLIGFFESASFPAIYHFFPIWVPNTEKTFLIPFIVSGIYLGQIVGFSFSGILAASDFYIGGDYYGGWQSVFYVFGLLGLLWFPLWIYAAYESPSVHPYISTEEFQFMRSATSYGMTGDSAAKGANPTASDDNDDIECINFDNLHEVSQSAGRRKRGAGGGKRRMLRGFSFIRTAFVGIRQPSSSSASLRSAGRYDRVSGMDVSVTGNEGNGAINNHNSEDDPPVAGRGGYGIQNTERSIELSPIHDDQDGLGYDSIAFPKRQDSQTRGMVIAEPLSPRRAQQTQASEALEQGQRQGQGGTVAPVVLNRAQDEEEMIRARIELATRTPWREFLTHPVALVLMAANFQYGWMNFTLMSEMPSFFTDVLGFDLRSAGVLCIFPYLALFVSALCFGNFFSYLEHQRGWRVTDVRRAAQFIAYFCSGLGLILCGYADSAMKAYGFMILTLVFFGANQSGLGCVWTDIAPNYSSTLNSIGNTIGAVAGILGPIVVAACTDTWPARGEGWRVAFFITFALSCLTLTLWFLCIKAEIVPVLNSPRRLF